ncbi:MAG TPA: hypothetical protein VGH19_23460 [Verrucomicrobiae bacterium]
MKTGTAQLLKFSCVLSLFLFIGCTSPPSPAKNVTLSLTEATLQHEDSYYRLTCTAILDNQTGQTLFVTTSFDSPFDHLRPVIYDAHGQLLHDENDTNKTRLIFDYRSPYHLGKPYPLATGRSTNELHFLLPFTIFPIRTYTVTNHPSVKVSLAGFLTGSSYPYQVKSQIVPVTAAAPESKPTSRPYLWETSAP